MTVVMLLEQTPVGRTLRPRRHVLAAAGSQPRAEPQTGSDGGWSKPRRANAQHATLAVAMEVATVLRLVACRLEVPVPGSVAAEAVVVVVVRAAALRVEQQRAQAVAVVVAEVDI